MNKKQISLQKQRNKLKVLIDKMNEDLDEFENFPPKSKAMKQEAILRIVHSSCNIVEKIKVIRRKQVEILEE